MRHFQSNEPTAAETAEDVRTVGLHFAEDIDLLTGMARNLRDYPIRTGRQIDLRKDKERLVFSQSPGKLAAVIRASIDIAVLIKNRHARTVFVQPDYGLRHFFRKGVENMQSKRLNGRKTQEKVRRNSLPADRFQLAQYSKGKERISPGTKKITRYLEPGSGENPPPDSQQLVVQAGRQDFVRTITWL
jgi:hypothetical protein